MNEERKNRQTEHNKIFKIFKITLMYIYISLFLNKLLQYIGIENYKYIHGIDNYKYIHVQLQLQRNRNGHRD